MYINIWSEKDIKIISLHFFLCGLKLCPLKYFDSKGILAIFVVKCDILTILDYMSFFLYRYLWTFREMYIVLLTGWSCFFSSTNEDLYRFLVHSFIFAIDLEDLLWEWKLLLNHSLIILNYYSELIPVVFVCCFSVLLKPKQHLGSTLK